MARQPSLHLVDQSIGATYCGRDGQATTVPADVTCGNCRRIARLDPATETLTPQRRTYCPHCGLTYQHWAGCPNG